MSGEVEKCPILHVCPKFNVFTLVPVANCVLNIYTHSAVPRFTGKTAEIPETPKNNRDIFNCAFPYSGQCRKFISKLQINILENTWNTSHQ